MKCILLASGPGLNIMMAYIFYLILLSVLSILSAAYVRNDERSSRASSVYLFGSLISVSLTTSFEVIELGISAQFPKFILYVLSGYSLYLVALFWTFFAFEYADLGTHKKKYFYIPVILFSVYLAILFVFQYTHETLIKNPVIVGDFFTVFDGKKTLLYFSTVIGTEIYVLIGLFVFLKFTLSRKKTKPALIFLVFSSVSILAPSLSLVIDSHLSLTRLSFGIFIFGVLFSTRMDLLIKEKIAHEAVYEIISEDVLIFNNQRELVSLNKDKSVFDISEKDIGKDVYELLPDKFIEKFNDVEVEDEVEFEYSVREKFEEYKVKIVTSKMYNKKVGYTVFFRDISNLKRSQYELENDNKKLEDFASFISHDLRNPLNALYGSAEVVESEAKKVDDKRLQKASEIVMSSTKRIDNMINDLEKLFRESVKEPDLDVIRLKRVSEDAINIINRSKDTNATISISEANIIADESKLKTIFENLFKNSIEHGATEIEVEYDKESEKIKIIDNGEGINEGVRIFEFGSSGKGSTGRGLAVVSEMVDSHGWEIYTENGYDGACFVIENVKSANQSYI